MSNASKVAEERVSYAAFLRGINVGGRRSLRMADLKRVLMAQGYTNVKTVLASGNVRFAAAETDIGKLQAAIEHLLEQEFGLEIPTLIRPLADLKSLVRADPFKDIADNPQTKLYITFLPDGASRDDAISSEFAAAGVAFSHATASEVCTAITLSQNFGTIEFMALLEKRFGPGITTRTWNTIVRLTEAK